MLPPQLSRGPMQRIILLMLALLVRRRRIFRRRVTCGQANFHSSLPMSQHFKLRQGHFVGDAHRVRSLVPLIPDVSHRITNWVNDKKRKKNTPFNVYVPCAIREPRTRPTHHVSHSRARLIRNARGVRPRTQYNRRL